MPESSSEHVPVLLAEVIHWLDPRPGQRIVDGTLGGAGHTRILAQRVAPDGLVIGLDRDPEALTRASSSLVGLPVKLVSSNFSEIPDVLQQLNTGPVDAVLLDLGLSSDQLADEDRGFSFHATGPLDLRFDRSAGEPAWQLLARLPEVELARIIFEYGEERFSRRIARAITERRRDDPVRTAQQLAALARRCIPRSGSPSRIDPATRTFQALRIAVNRELESLDDALARIPECLRVGGRLAVISFHSLEDRRVKYAFRDDPRWQVLTKKPLRPADEELARNPRSRSAKLRVAERTTRDRAATAQ